MLNFLTKVKSSRPGNGLNDSASWATSAYLNAYGDRGLRAQGEKFSASIDVAQNKYGYTLLQQNVKKQNLFKYNGLCGLQGARKTKKKGDPKNEGKSKDVYENKGQEKSARESL
jgi:hypothetical protein